jgi:hypothetical protein
VWQRELADLTAIADGLAAEDHLQILNRLSQLREWLVEWDTVQHLDRLPVSWLPWRSGRIP